MEADFLGYREQENWWIMTLLLIFLLLQVLLLPAILILARSFGIFQKELQRVASGDTWHIDSQMKHFDEFFGTLWVALYEVTLKLRKKKGTSRALNKDEQE